MVRTLLGLLTLVSLAGCGVGLSGGGAPPPSVEDAEVLLDEIIAAGIDRDWERLCANASGTCEGELQGAEERAPTSAPRVAAVEVHDPQRDGETWTSGGVLFVLCGVDGLGDPYESEVLVFDDGDRLLAGAAVYWKGTAISFASPGIGVVGEPSPGERQCP